MKWKTQLSLLCNQGWSKTPSWSGTCQSPLLIWDSFLHQQLLLRGSFKCLISFLSWCHEVFVRTSSRYGTIHRPLSSLVCHVIASFEESGFYVIHQVFPVILATPLSSCSCFGIFFSWMLHCTCLFTCFDLVAHHDLILILFLLLLDGFFIMTSLSSRISYQLYISKAFIGVKGPFFLY